MPRKSGGAGLPGRALTESSQATAREILRQLDQVGDPGEIDWRGLGLPVLSYLGETADQVRARAVQTLDDGVLADASGVLKRVADHGGLVSGGLVSRSSNVPAARTGDRTRLGVTSVELSAAAYRFIRSELEDGLEMGGALLGYERGDGVIAIVEASGPQPDARRGPRFIEQNYDRFVAFERFYRDRGLPSRFCGDWHTHSTNGTPSGPDLRGWEAFFRSSIGFYVGLIASPQRPDSGALRWLAAPKLSAWVLRREDGVFSRDPVDVTIAGAA